MNAEATSSEPPRHTRGKLRREIRIRLSQLSYVLARNHPMQGSPKWTMDENALSETTHHIYCGKLNRDSMHWYDIIHGLFVSRYAGRQTLCDDVTGVLQACGHDTCMNATKRIAAIWMVLQKTRNMAAITVPIDFECCWVDASRRMASFGELCLLCSDWHIAKIVPSIRWK